MLLRRWKRVKPIRLFSDEEVLEFAASQTRGVLTLNRKHFIRLHHLGKPHWGIIACIFDPEFAAQARRIDEQLRAATNLQQNLIRITALLFEGMYGPPAQESKVTAFRKKRWGSQSIKGLRVG